MAKFGIFASLVTIVAALGFASLGEAGNPTPCNTKDLKTQLIKQACTTGGQPAAKDAMKKFMKDAKIKSCLSCHAHLAPKYDLKPDGLELRLRTQGLGQVVQELSAIGDGFRRAA